MKNEKLLKKKGFYKWFDNYSQKHHGLKGWLENDLYLDEVELPVELMNTLIVEWLRIEHNINISIHFSTMFNKGKYCILIHDVKYCDIKAIPNNIHSGYESPQDASLAGIEYVLKKLI